MYAPEHKSYSVDFHGVHVALLPEAVQREASDFMKAIVDDSGDADFGAGGSGAAVGGGAGMRLPSAATLAALFLGATVCEHGKLLRAASEIGLDFVNEWATDEANGAKANAKRACRLALDELKAGGSWITDPDSKGFYTLVALLHARMSEESHKELFIDFTFRLTDRLDAKSDQYYEYVAGIIEGLGMDGDGVQEALLAEFQAR